MVTPRQAIFATALGLVPTTGYAVWSPEVFPYVAVVNVVLITVALYLMMSPSQESVSPA
ncbi:hypothetical protein EGH25_07185 [Haladaptatus sp. F3-133]|jgi:hypothetical protein|uniref:DUF8131 domain-containing protein n=1 Tax=Halorutilus salinus TaxID=2487751 RepID=A0A9Q4C557_9EURY|nr:hypothetical protein [Halorutilus salinus]MCX2819134.1 hypothetical protein [Halorutilus salinus]